MTTDEAVEWAKSNVYTQADVYRMAKELYQTGYISKEDLPKLNEMLGLPEAPKEEPNAVIEWLKKQ